MKKIIGVIPARYASTRFPGKPLAMIKGKSMIQRVYKNVKEVKELADVYVATDDMRIYDAVTAFGGKCIMTSDCNCGTERVWLAAQGIDCDIVINIQGDEPLLGAAMIRDLLTAFEDETVEMATLKKPINTEQELDDPNAVKVVTDENDDAIYFSRHCIPYNLNKIPDVTWYKHIGLYGYKKEFLQLFTTWPVGFLESCESLEQLRVLEHGHKIRVVKTIYDSVGVDIPEHIHIIEKALEEKEKKDE